MQNFLKEPKINRNMDRGGLKVRWSSAQFLQQASVEGKSRTRSELNSLTGAERKLFVGRLILLQMLCCFLPER